MPIIESRCSRSACAATFALPLLACSLMPDFSSAPKPSGRAPQWGEAASNVAGITGTAPAIIAAGMSAG